MQCHWLQILTIHTIITMVTKNYTAKEQKSIPMKGSIPQTKKKTYDRGDI